VTKIYRIYVAPEILLYESVLLAVKLKTVIHITWGVHFDIEENNTRCVEPAQMDRDLFEKQWWGD